MEKKTPKRKAYLNDFQLDEQGEYVYQGILHTYQNEHRTYKESCFRQSIYASIMFLCALIAGLFPAEGTTHTFYVVVPYAVCLITLCIFLYKFVSFLFGKNPLRDYIYQKTVPLFPVFLNVLMIMSLIAFFTEILYLFLHGFTRYHATTILYLFCMFGIFLACILWRKDLKDDHWIENK